MKYFVLDSDIITYYLKGNSTIIARVNQESDNHNSLIIPLVVYYEIKRWLTISNSKKRLAIFENICSYSGIDIIDKEVFDIAVLIYVDLTKNGITISDNDIFIAAYCIKNKYTLVTNNTNHFKSIKNLEVVNWIN
jgi:tRNA(fMet)-specific endonuclease VapC